MPTLKDALISALGEDLKEYTLQRPSDVSAFIVPRMSFRAAAKVMLAQGARLAAEWATDDAAFKKGFSVHAAYNLDGEFLIVSAEMPEGGPSFPSITKKYLAAYRFERQIWSLFGILPEGHPDMRPWIKHEDWPADIYPLRKSFDGKTYIPKAAGTYVWVRAEGEGVYEIPVGPVHAGIIEPGHFRFQAVGEDIINMEARLGYTHKGIEKRFEQMDWASAARLAGRVSGDTSVGHATAYAEAVESASGTIVGLRAQYLRAILLERERMANHLGDIGAICNDAAFTFMLYQMSILREKMLRTNAALFGHRLTFDCVMPGGVSSDITREGKETIKAELSGIEAEFDKLVRIYEDNPSLEDRVYSTGILTPPDAKAFGVVGFVARASGVANDARILRPTDAYRKVPPIPPLLTSGDVHARAWVRIVEVRDSIRIIRMMLDEMPEGELSVEFTPPAPGACGFSAVEGWRGEIIYWVQAGPQGEINRCMVRDPSSVNWIAIEQAIKGNIVPDFPLCNKSFNQSYSGNDL
ncbi:MAG: NADH-quinone oxidoreductase subunit C [Deltaproteobacteria bacterium]|nr:NADH-quinone oxidoreductase subunit C [Deltaproteobacteria bacterium]